MNGALFLRLLADVAVVANLDEHFAHSFTNLMQDRWEGEVGYDAGENDQKGLAGDDDVEGDECFFHGGYGFEMSRERLNLRDHCTIPAMTVS